MQNRFRLRRKNSVRRLLNSGDDWVENDKRNLFSIKKAAYSRSFLSYYIIVKII